MSCKPTDNVPPTTPATPGENPWAPKDESGALLTGEAVRCCHCQRVIAKRYVTIKNGHVFCPDHVNEGSCSCKDHFNVRLFIRACRD